MARRFCIKKQGRLWLVFRAHPKGWERMDTCSSEDEARASITELVTPREIFFDETGKEEP